MHSLSKENNSPKTPLSENAYQTKAVIIFECNISEFPFPRVIPQIPKECHNLPDVDYDTLLVIYDTNKKSGIYRVFRYSLGV